MEGVHKNKTMSPTLAALGQRLRAARLDKRMTQEELAGPEFSTGYVSALERGTVRPSLKALEIFANRLGLPLGSFLAEPENTAEAEHQDLEALEEDLHYQLNYARMLVNMHKSNEALDLIGDAAQSVASYLPSMTPRARYRIHQVRGMAFVKNGLPTEALKELQLALEQVGDATEDKARIHNLIGVVYYQQEQPRLALEQHLLSSHAIESGSVRDRAAQLSIYRNLANAYWALNEHAQAREIYKRALALLNDLNNLEDQAAIFWGLALGYKAEGDWVMAKLNANRALTIFEAQGNRIEGAAMCLNLAEIVIGDSASKVDEHTYREAETLLKRADTLLIGTGDQDLRSVWHRDYAELCLHRSDLEGATQHAKRSVAIAQALIGSIPDKGKQPWISAMRTYAEALQVAAQIEEHRHNTDEADRLFKAAIAAIKQTTFKESLHSITIAYATALEARGATHDALRYYKDAALSRSIDARHQ
jgi:transcriptional regulator with XRE-family HTH domain